MSTEPTPHRPKSWVCHLRDGLLAIWHIPGRAWSGALASGTLTIWMRFGGVVMVTAMAILLIWIIWKGPWTLAVEAKRVDWLGLALMGALFTILVSIVALFDFRLNFKASRDGLVADMGDDDHVTTTTTTTATATTTGTS